jgi:hypothetical protein
MSRVARAVTGCGLRARATMTWIKRIVREARGLHRQQPLTPRHAYKPQAHHCGMRISR